MEFFIKVMIIKILDLIFMLLGFGVIKDNTRRINIIPCNNHFVSIHLLLFFIEGSSIFKIK